jgi:hypothetical protein
MLLLLATAVAASAAQAQLTPALYGSAGVAPAAVIQGTLGSCYFHATVAAIAVHHGDMLRNAIEEQGNGVYRVSFRNAQAETIHVEDVVYARQNGFDRSEGLWVAVLLRGLGQRTVRESLEASFAVADLPGPAKSMAKSLLGSNDALLLAYDRAIRATIQQDGTLNRETLRTRLRQKISELGVPGFLSEPVVSALDAAGFFETLSKKVMERGELFGAYRSVSQGGLPTAVIEAFYGPAESVNLRGGNQARSVLSAAERNGTPLVAIATGSASDSVKARVHTKDGQQDWYVGNHAYTVVSYDASTDRATMRNPWGHNPSPGGTFTISMDDLADAFPILATPSR